MFYIPVYEYLNFLHTLSFCVLILNNMGSSLSKAQFCTPQNSRFMIKQRQIRQLMLLQVQSGVTGPGPRAGSSSSLWAIRTSKPYRVTKPNSKCRPPLYLGLGECGSGTGRGGVCCCSPSQLKGWRVILDWSVCMAGVPCLLANQGALCCWVRGFVLEVSLDTSGLSQVGKCLSGKGTKHHSTFFLRGKQSVPISAEQG